jgi:hypothetical protein
MLPTPYTKSPLNTVTFQHSPDSPEVASKPLLNILALGILGQTWPARFGREKSEKRGKKRRLMISILHTELILYTIYYILYIFDLIVYGSYSVPIY